KLVFKNANGTETYNVNYNNIGQDSIIELSMSGKSPGSMAEVVAYYTPTTTPTQTFAIGAFNVQFYEQKTLNVVLVNLGGATMPAANAVKDSLNRIYGSAFVKWNVTSVTYNLAPGISKNIHVESSGLLSNYMPDMQSIVSSFKDNCPSYDGSSDNTYYLLFGCTNDSDPLNKLTGYMPRARNTGFIFDTDIRTIAHELGHGAFNLKHIFSSDELGEGYKRQTDNLMDYVEDSKLYKYQWDLIHNPASVSWFGGDDDDGSSQTMNTLAALQAYKNSDNSFTFFSTGGTPITIPGNATNVRFSTSDNYVDLSTGQRASYTPIGTLLSFNIGTKYYRGRGNNTGFTHYLTGDTEQYIDSLTNKLNPGAAIVAIAYYENGKVGINFLKVNYNTSGIPKTNTGIGTYGLTNVTKVIDLAEGTTTALVADYSFHKVALGIKVDSIPVSPPLSYAAWKFLEDNKEMTTYSISIAPLI
ncbi:MAG: hypothetical protein O9353_14280, partial [Bacteroidia bacterium]|nr:hypothetical protein [Bacteroidia bacterium]